MFVFLAGNMSEGYVAYGPYSSLDYALDNCDGMEGWVMEMAYPLGGMVNNV
jgi:hypothetical protein